jgi:hypothetical protein
LNSLKLLLLFRSLDSLTLPKLMLSRKSPSLMLESSLEKKMTTAAAMRQFKLLVLAAAEVLGCLRYV